MSIQVQILVAPGGLAASPDFLKVVADYVLAAKPNLVVECSSGLSTVVIARCLQINGVGRVVTMEHMPQFAEITRPELKRQGLSDRAVGLDAPLVPTYYRGRLSSGIGPTHCLGSRSIS